ncbi:SGNH/GDSL hydrolase family protein [Mucilaginibacter yixingensis]|nr:SGNH/GDSL hydrolase family protein [Mucilaginibacter yixingensis]
MKRLSILFFLFISATALAQQALPYNDTRIHYMGRVQMQNGSAVLSWSGNSATINFNGTGADAILSDEKGDNFLDVIVDGKVVNVIHPDTTMMKRYELVTGLPAGSHQLTLFKRTEWVMGSTRLYQFLLNKDSKPLAAPAAKKRKIEFYGNSITCAMAVIDSSGKDRGTGPYEDNYQSYAAITARHFDAEYSCIARSGIGVMVSWFPLIMPEMYDRLNPADPGSKWDFKNYTPDVVVINLFQNDSWLVHRPEHAEFKHRFGDKAPEPAKIVSAYKDFVKNIRSKYPKAQIICALGNMDATQKDSPWPGYIEKAVGELKDTKIYTHFFVYKNTPGHPNVKEQQAMADELIAFIDQHIKW